jgi:hypothetical protein
MSPLAVSRRSSDYNASPAVLALTQVTPPAHPPKTPLGKQQPASSPAPARFPPATATRLHTPRMILPSPEDATAFFGMRTASVHDTIFTLPGTASTPARARGEGARLSVGAAATPRIRPPVLAGQTGAVGEARARRVARNHWLYRHARRFNEVLASVFYCAEARGFRVAEGDVDGPAALLAEAVDDGDGRAICLDAGVRATRVPLPYAINLWTGDGASGAVKVRILRNECEGAFVSLVQGRVERRAEDAAGSPDPVALMFWAAPTGDSAQVVLELEVDGSFVVLSVDMQGVQARFHVGGAEKHSAVQFSPGVAHDDRTLTVTNATDGDAPLILSLYLADSAGGAFQLVPESADDREEDGEIVVLLPAGASYAFEAVFDAATAAADPSARRSLATSPPTARTPSTPSSSPASPLTPSRERVLGLAKIKIPAFVSGDPSHAVDRDLLHYFDHVIDLVRPPAAAPFAAELNADLSPARAATAGQEAEAAEGGVQAEEEGDEDGTIGFEEEPLLATAERRATVGEALEVDAAGAAHATATTAASATGGAYEEDYEDHDNDQCRDLDVLQYAGAFPAAVDNTASFTFDAGPGVELGAFDFLADYHGEGGGLLPLGFRQSSCSLMGEDGYLLTPSELPPFPPTDERAATVSACLPMAEADTSDDGESAPVQPRIRLARRCVAAGGMEVGSGALAAHFSIANSCAAPLRMTASLPATAATVACVELLQQRQEVLVQPGERLELQIVRTARGRAHGSTLTIRCATAPADGRRRRRVKYEIPLHVFELALPAKDLVPSGFATDRPAVAFYGCVEECSEDVVKMADEIRVFNGTPVSVPFSAKIAHVVAHDVGGGGARLAPAFTLGGPVPDMIAPRSWVPVTVLFCAPNDESYFCGELQLSVGPQADHRIPLFGYGGSSDVRVHVEDAEGGSRPPEQQAVVVNRGTRTATVDISCAGAVDAPPEQHRVAPGGTVVLPIAPRSPAAAAAASAPRELALITARDDILESRVRHVADQDDDGVFDWDAAHASASAFHYDGRALDFYGRQCTLLSYPAGSTAVAAAPDAARSSRGVLPPHRFAATYMPTAAPGAGGGGAGDSAPAVGAAAGARVVVHNLDARRALSFAAAGCEPARGRVPPFGDAELYVCGGRVEVCAPARDATLRADDMPWAWA